MDERVKQAVEEFVTRLGRTYAKASVEPKDYKWSTEDVSLEIRNQFPMTEDEEDQLSDLTTKLAGDLFDEMGVFILTLVRSADGSGT